ncbi:MAG: mercuric transporter MerT family protein [Thermoanaerobaculia bacterium]
MEEAKKSTLLNVSAMLAAVGASVCCTLPIVVAVLGVGSAALGATIAPLTPWFTGLTVLLLGYAFYRTYRPVKCEPGQTCAVPASRRRQRIALWIVAVVALLLVTFPYYAAWVL